jgi:hypothetical protein
MRERLGSVLAGWLLAAAMLGPGGLGPLQAQTKKPEPPGLKVGDVAPDFTLEYFDGTGEKKISLADYRGKKNVVLAFYIFAFTGG